MLTADRFPARLRPPAGAPVRAVAAAGLAVSFLLLAGCGGGGGSAEATAVPSSSPTATADDFGCLSPEQARTNSVTFPSSSGQDVAAFADGTGHTALILTHQADGDVCQWVPHAMELAKDGYRVVAVDSVGDDVAEVTAAVTWARAKGATKVLLVGASKGGTAVLEAAGSITPPVDGVVSLSAPTSYGAMDAAPVVPRLTMPVFYMASDLDSPFADAAKELSKSTKKAKENDLTIVDGTNHGVSMLNDATNYTKVKDFLKKYGS
ncbi:MAG: alpha/beta hydrolase [Actinomycetia bacterium]|nr:alpha/beta hydrolase [Actinomycetes bacterium]